MSISSYLSYFNNFEIIIIFNILLNINIFSFIAGVIELQKLPGLQRMLFRVCQGNFFLRIANIEEKIIDPNTVFKIWLNI